ncbi:adenosine receptor A3-like [Diadema antillarum]|uniref:adenosine receptor A3-like n=1 Tax=Diadema antillarum TaxID=105358 RepID=UPI003A8A0236
MDDILQSLNETGGREVVTELILASAESEVAYFETVPVEWMDIAYYGSEVILGVCATIGNTAVVVAVAVTRELHTVPNTYLVSLAISDLCMGVLGIPILLLALNGWPRNYGLCLTLLTVVLLLDLCSIYSLLAHTFNQFYSTCYPLHYPRVSTRNRVVLHLVLAWLVPLSIALVMPLGWNDGYPSMGYCKLIRVVSMDFLAFMFLAGMIPPFLAMCFMYTRIFKAIARQVGTWMWIRSTAGVIRPTVYPPCRTFKCTL